jgi:hypothetical protein
MNSELVSKDEEYFWGGTTNAGMEQGWEDGADGSSHFYNL